MKRTMIYLEDSQHDRLTRLAGGRSLSFASLVRAAVETYLAAQERPRPGFIGSGLGPPGECLSEHCDDYLRELLGP